VTVNLIESKHDSLRKLANVLNSGFFMTYCTSFVYHYAEISRTHSCKLSLNNLGLIKIMLCCHISFLNEKLKKCLLLSFSCECSYLYDVE